MSTKLKCHSCCITAASVLAAWPNAAVEAAAVAACASAAREAAAVAVKVITCTVDVFTPLAIRVITEELMFLKRSAAVK